MNSGAAAPSSLMEKTPEEAPFTPRIRAHACFSIGERENVSARWVNRDSEPACWLPTQKTTAKGKESFSANSNKEEMFPQEAISFALHRFISRYFRHSINTIILVKYANFGLVLIIYFKWCRQLQIKGVLFISTVQMYVVDLSQWYVWTEFWKWFLSS